MYTNRDVRLNRRVAAWSKQWFRCCFGHTVFDNADIFQGQLKRLSSLKNSAEIPRRISGSQGFFNSSFRIASRNRTCVSSFTPLTFRLDSFLQSQVRSSDDQNTLSLECVQNSECSRGDLLSDHPGEARERTLQSTRD